MAATVLTRSAQSLRSQVFLQLRRHLCVTSVLAQKSTQSSPDLIQQLFVTKIREYAKLTKSAGGKMPDADPVAQKTLDEVLKKLANQFGVQEGKEQEFAKFPKFEFIDKKEDLRSLPVNAQELDAELMKAEETEK